MSLCLNYKNTLQAIQDTVVCLLYRRFKKNSWLGLRAKVVSYVSLGLG